MSRNRSQNYDREYSQMDRLKRENQQLKRELSRLRKIVDRLNLNESQFRNLKELVDQQAKEAKNVVKAKRDWICFTCGKGVMKIHIIQRRDGTFYWRVCSLEECGHRTKLKRYDENVEES